MNMGGGGSEPELSEPQPVAEQHRVAVAPALKNWLISMVATDELTMSTVHAEFLSTESCRNTIFYNFMLYSTA
jgi:hypothetical protein